jgi:hypothetical protein
MSSAEVTIAEAAASPNARLYWRIVLKSASGEPAAGVELKASLVGDGSLAPQFDSKEVVRTTDEDGMAHVTWYRRNIWGRPVKATLSVTAPDEGSVTLEAMSEPPADMQGPRTGWTLQRRRW